MPPETGEEVRGLLQLYPDAAVVVTAPQSISESAMRKVVVMAWEYRTTLLRLVQGSPGGGGQAGQRLAEVYGLPLLGDVPYSEHIVASMEAHLPFDHQMFLPVAQGLAQAVCPSQCRQRRKRRCSLEKRKSGLPASNGWTCDRLPQAWSA